MKKLLMSVVLLAGAMMAGCTSAESAREHFDRYDLQAQIESRRLVDDWDSFWLIDRTCQANRWNTRLGY